MGHRSLSEFVDAASDIGEVGLINGASWNLEIGALTELASDPNAPLLLFDDIDGYRPGRRVATNVISTPRRFALALDLPIDAHPTELLRMWKNQMAEEDVLIKPSVIDAGPITQHVLSGNEIDVAGEIPAPHWHEADGGRYIGTGDVVITRDPDSSWTNMGTYRICIHGNNLLSIWMVSSKHGKKIAQKYWSKGKPCPIVAILGPTPTLFVAATTALPENVSELEYAGGLLGEPVEVVKGEVTGLPIPAHSEIACEGYLLPPSERTLDEGPYGEWVGYYAHQGREPAFVLERLMYRDNPILYGAPTMAPFHANSIGISKYAAHLWHHLEQAGITDVTAVNGIQNSLYAVIRIRQRYAGHAKQALLAAAGLRSATSVYRYFIVVDDDVDVTNQDEVLWAMATRVEPSIDIDIVRNAWTGSLDPILSPEKRSSGDLTSSRVLIDACRPFTWRDQFPEVNRVPPDQRERVAKKWAATLDKLMGTSVP